MKLNLNYMLANPNCSLYPDVHCHWTEYFIEQSNHAKQYHIAYFI